MTKKLTIQAGRILVIPQGFGQYKVIAFQFKRDILDKLKALVDTGEKVELDLEEPDNGTHSGPPRLIQRVEIPNEYPRHGYGPTDVLIVDIGNF